MQEWVGGWTDGRINMKLDGQIKNCMDWKMDDRTDKRMNKFADRKFYNWIDKWMNWRMYAYNYPDQEMTN